MEVPEKKKEKKKENDFGKSFTQFKEVVNPAFKLLTSELVGDLSEIEFRLGSYENGNIGNGSGSGIGSGSVSSNEKFTSGVDIKIFGDIHQFCKNRCEYDGELSTTLDISVAGNADRERLTINDLIKIQQYCLQSIVNYSDHDVSLMTKKLIKHVDISNYNLRMSHSHETKIEKTESGVSSILSNPNKSFRLKSRKSYTFDSIRVDLTQVKTATGSDMVKSKVLNSPEIYEVECEFIKKVTSSSELTHDEIELIYRLLCVKNKTFNLISQEQYVNTLRQYYSLISTDNYSAQKITSLSTQQLQPTVGNDPKTCMLNKGDYAVTYKVDGLHNMLYIDDTGVIYLIDDSKNVNYLGYRSYNYQKCIFECELYKNEDSYSVYIFDCLFSNNVDVRGYPLVDDTNMSKGMIIAGEDRNMFIKLPTSQLQKHTSRLARVYELKITTVDTSSTMNTCDFYIKNHIFMPHNFFANVKKFIETTPPVNIDGLVFSKVSQPYPKQSGGTNLTIFKYKSVEHLSIDFQVVFFGGGRRPLIEGNKAKVKLMVGNYKNRKYGLEEFMTTSIELIDDQLKTRDGQLINNNAIVEFVKGEKYWIPIRLRPDKQQPNAKWVVDDTVKTIENPITTDMVCGKEVVKSTYISVRTNKSLVESISKYHNEIKNLVLEMLCNKLRKTNPSVFIRLADFCCGRAADSNKWISNNINYVMGIDNSEDQIDNGNKRLAENRSYTQQRSKHSCDVNLIVGDLSRPLEQCVEPENIAEFNKVLSSFIYNCNIVTCNFAIHYFASSNEVMDTFLNNVSKCLKTDGYFVGTMMDGTIVRKLLADNDGKYTVTNKDGTEILSIVAKNPVQSVIKGLGFAIEVTFAGLIENKIEYLIDPQELITHAKKFNLISDEISEESSFSRSTILNMMDFIPTATSISTQTGTIGTAGTFAKSLSKDYDNLSDTDKEISKLYKVFIFKKQPTKSTGIRIKKTL